MTAAAHAEKTQLRQPYHTCSSSSLDSWPSAQAGRRDRARLGEPAQRHSAVPAATAGRRHCAGCLPAKPQAASSAEPPQRVTLPAPWSTSACWMRRARLGWAPAAWTKDATEGSPAGLSTPMRWSAAAAQAGGEANCGTAPRTAMTSSIWDDKCTAGLKRVCPSQQYGCGCAKPGGAGGAAGFTVAPPAAGDRQAQRARTCRRRRVAMPHLSQGCAQWAGVI